MRSGPVFPWRLLTECRSQPVFLSSTPNGFRRGQVLASPLARIPDRFSQHGVELTLCEFLRLPYYCLPRHHLCHRAGTGSQQHRSSLRRGPYLGFCCWRLMTTLQVQTRQLGADRVTAIPEATCDLRGALSYCPKFFEQCYVFRIPTHGKYYTPTPNYKLVTIEASRRGRTGVAQRASASRSSRYLHDESSRPGDCKRGPLRHGTR